MTQDTPMTTPPTPPPPPPPPPTTTANTIESILSNYQTSTKTLLTTLSTLSSTPPSSSPTDDNNITHLLQTASSEILALKSHQRSACLLLEDKLDEVKQVRQTVDSHRLLLENLAYERDNLLKQINYCRGFETRELERMAREEMGEGEVRTKTETTTASTHDVIHSFLMTGDDRNETTKLDKNDDDDGTTATTSSNDYRNAKYHSANIQKLRFDVSERRRLLELLSQRKRELSREEQTLQQKQSFLKELPLRLEQVEAATMPLQDYFDVGLRRTMGGGGGGGAWGSSERRKRVRLAEGLSGPLYTLCSQIQGYIDAFDDEVKMAVVEGGGVGTTAKQPQGNNNKDTSLFEYHSSMVTVTFTASPPSSSSSSSSSYKVTIHFRHCKTLNIVTAEAVVSGNKYLDAAFLLRNLFPDDTGETTPNLANYHHHSTTTMATTTTTPSQTTLTPFTNARPYVWVQYLSGLFFLPDNDEIVNDDVSEKKRQRRDVVVHRLKKMSQNTASIMIQLKHRIRSHATLSYLLHSLSSHPHRIPTPPPPSEGGVMGSSTGDDNSSSNMSGSQQAMVVSPTVYLSSWTVVTDVTALPFAIVMSDRHSCSSSSSSSSSSPRPSSSCIYYRAKFQKHGTSSSSSSNPLFETVVRISCEYPHIPPFWIHVNNNATSDATTTTPSLACPPLYNDDDEALLRKVNNAMEDYFVSDIDGDDKTTSNNDNNDNDDDDDGDDNDNGSSSHVWDWILCHQLKIVLSYWESRVNGTKQQQQPLLLGGGGGGRVRMGRDRVYKGYYQ